MTLCPALDKRAKVARKMVAQGLCDPLDAIEISCWPSERTAALIAALPNSRPWFHGTPSGRERCDCERCRAAKRLSNRLAA